MPPLSTRERGESSPVAEPAMVAPVPSADMSTIRSFPHSSRKSARSRTMGPEALVTHGQKLAVAMFLEGPDAVRTLGITSPIGGEGKTLLAAMTAVALSRASSTPTTLVECNWQHPTLHELFDTLPAPGLAEWLRGECALESVHYQVSENLTIIPAGNAGQSELLLLERLRKAGVRQLVGDEGFLVVDLPPILSTSYGLLAASLADALVIVSRAGVTPTDALAETCSALADLPVRGVALNQVAAYVPAWIDRIL